MPIPRIAAALLLVSGLSAHVALAQAPLLTGLGGPRGFGRRCLTPTDDGSSSPINLTLAFPEGLRFFTATHTRAFVNANGNLSFGSPVLDFTPERFPVADQPMIAPYWADVDTRAESIVGGFRTCVPAAGNGRGPCENPTDNGIWYYWEAGLLVATWEKVGYFECREDKRMSFQLILTAVEESCGTGGDFDVEFRYNRCEWTTGDESGGSGGLGGTRAQAGFDAGDSLNFVEIMGSRGARIHRILCNESNVGEPGVWRFQIRSGTVICPEAGDVCDTGVPGACREGVTQCTGDMISCQSVVEPRMERCDAVDNDCNGIVDDGDLCDVGEICDRGGCVSPCFEGGCPDGQACTDSRRCVAAGCETVDCPEGQRCVDGGCVDACSAVVCPGSQSCRGGRCLNLCDELICDDCTVCVGGACAPRCQFVACRAGQTCLADGRCVETSCREVSCAEGELCTGGACVDACSGTLCPAFEVCELGACVVAPPPAPRVDAGPARPEPMPDAGTEECEADCAKEDGGCGCRLAVSHSFRASSWLLALLLLLQCRRRGRALV